VKGSFIDLFPTRVGLFEFEDEEAKKKLEELSHGIKTGPSRRFSNLIGFQSFDLRFDVVPESFLKFVSQSILSLALEILKEDKELKVNIENYWMNSNQKHASNAEHTHPFCDYGAVYYVTAPEMCGNLCFYDPARELKDRGFLHNHCEQNPDWLKNRTMHSTRWQVKPKVGQLVVFPAHLTHSVEPNWSDEDRVSFAFNATVFK